MSDTETAYLLTRAQDEAIAAIRAEHPAVAAVHQRLSMLYSAKAIIKLGHEDEEEPGSDGPSLMGAVWRQPV